MAKKIQTIKTIPKMKKRDRVAAYARVSVDKGRTRNSFSQQVSYYSELIQKNPDWEYVGVYADMGISGTSTSKRTEFQQMLQDAEDGKIDIILTKSISRFARNTVDLLETVRHLKDIGVEVRFEKERINTFSGDGELMLSILASFAQEETYSISNNVKWSAQKRFQNGEIYTRYNVMGYHWDGDELIIDEEEAKTIRLLFQFFLEGDSRIRAGERLNDMGRFTRQGYKWVDSNVKAILKNPIYAGDLLFNKEYVEDPITKKRRINRGERPQYLLENHHEAIIDRETFNRTQEEMQRRLEMGPFRNKNLSFHAFSTKIKCAKCGKSYQRCSRKNTAKEILKTWVCANAKDSKPRECDSKHINEVDLEEQLAELLGTETFDGDVFLEKVDHIEVNDGILLQIFFKDGTVKEHQYISTARTRCWSDERRKAYSKKLSTRETCHMGNRISLFTCFIKCEKCVCNYRRQKGPKGAKEIHWRCGHDYGNCGNTSIRERIVIDILCDFLGIDEYDGNLAEDKIDHLSINDKVLTAHFKDGTTKSKEYSTKKIMPKYTPERREKHKETVRKGWVTRREKASKNNTSED